ncbi:MAG: FAD-dependent oxidoreductase, partial [Rhodospirillales bacterium]
MSYDLLIIGSGAAGLSLALRVLEAKPQARIAILAKGPLSEGSTMYAQGGIAAVLDATDTTDAHLADTLTAGGGLCNTDTVRFVVDNAKPAIQWLIDQGVLFDREGGDYHLTREGGHSHRRVIHSADATGRAVQTALMERIIESGAEVFEHHIAVDLIRERLGGGRLGRCVGAYGLDRSSGHVRTFPARSVVLATGGASRVYLYSSNP